MRRRDQKQQPKFQFQIIEKNKFFHHKNPLFYLTTIKINRNHLYLR